MKPKFLSLKNLLMVPLYAAHTVYIIRICIYIYVYPVALRAIPATVPGMLDCLVESLINSLVVC